eukprot:TRINITY_DN2641_c0_g1_i1.p1 TRINITY_DN2641_c0_g1~~TRINITY_DN2641_c0_g1_i1.p1  ORF type:complete len:207 (-),score=22.74 TRINITY_DN2641_c0_g1_i1:190-810(-)
MGRILKSMSSLLLKAAVVFLVSMIVTPYPWAEECEGTLWNVTNSWSNLSAISNSTNKSDILLQVNGFHRAATKAPSNCRHFVRIASSVDISSSEAQLCEQSLGIVREISNDLLDLTRKYLISDGYALQFQEKIELTNSGLRDLAVGCSQTVIAFYQNSPSQACEERISVYRNEVVSAVESSLFPELLSTTLDVVLACADETLPRRR